VGPAKALESVGASWSAVSGEESAACRDAGGMMSAPDDAATSRTCSNVAKAGSEAEGAGDAADVVAIVEAALGELDAGRVNAAKARLGALVATVRARTQSGSRAP